MAGDSHDRHLWKYLHKDLEIVEGGKFPQRVGFLKFCRMVSQSRCSKQEWLMATQDIGNLDCTLIHISPESLDFPFQYILIYIVCCCVPLRAPSTYHSSLTTANLLLQLFCMLLIRCPIDQHCTSSAQLSGRQLQQRCVWDSWAWGFAKIWRAVGDVH